MRARPLEVKALLPLLEQEWDDSEDLAKALIAALDEARADRTEYVAVMQFGQGPGSVFYAGLGPFPGQRSAERAILRHPAVSAATRRAIIPIRSAAGFEILLKEVG